LSPSVSGYALIIIYGGLKMHWSDRLAAEIVKRSPDKPVYTCAAGISPSGSVHIGNFRDIATSLFVAKGLERLGKKARLLFSWDNFDRLRKIPANVKEIDSGMDKYIGYPYVDVRNPFPDGAASFAEHFEREFEDAVKRFGVDMVYRRQADLYRSGIYSENLILALKKRSEIFEILKKFKTQETTEEDSLNYYPVSIFCPECKRDSTKITSLSEDCTHATYECACGHKGEMDFAKDFNCKLAWKTDWAMRWMHEGVDFEPGGKDHAAPNGSYNTSKEIVEKIFGYPAPLFQGYEFIGIKGAAGKMSSSSGINLTPETLLKLYQPEVILWLYAKAEPSKAFNFCFDDGILNQYHEFDQLLKAFYEGKADENQKVIMDNCLISNREVKPIPMNLIVQLGSIVDFNVSLLTNLFERIGVTATEEDLRERLPLAQFWIEQCAPDMRNNLRAVRNWKAYTSFSDEEKSDIKALFDYLSAGGYTLDELSHKLYDIIKTHGEEDKNEVKKKQAAFFSNVYNLLLDRGQGPRLYLFLYAIDPARYMRLLDFSTPMLPEEEEKEPEPEAVPEKTYGEPDPVSPFGAEIPFEAFSEMDLRVCKVLKCTEIRKSNNCYKLVLFDGIGERVIVSSIKNDYTCDELIGKKIIVLANLKPAKIAGVVSQGMLLASTNAASGCKVVFVDDLVPEGTKVK
jgi:lysyl-tRNA synthetase class 1